MVVVISNADFDIADTSSSDTLTFSLLYCHWGEITTIQSIDSFVMQKANDKCWQGALFWWCKDGYCTQLQFDIHAFKLSKMLMFHVKWIPGCNYYWKLLSYSWTTTKIIFNFHNLYLCIWSSYLFYCNSSFSVKIYHSIIVIPENNIFKILVQ